MRLYTFLTALFFGVQTQLFAQAEEAAPPADQGFWQTLVMLAIFIVFFYVIMWRPEQKKRKALEEQRSSLKKGDRVIAMGIIGQVVRITDQSVILKMYDGAKLEFLKGAITDIIPAEEGDKKIEHASEE
jgi:preprotein translocase subunit YajC